MPSITFAGSDYSAGELETALNALVGGIIRYARAVVVPFAYVERDAYQARKAPAALDALAWLAVRDDAGANAKAILAQLKAEADRLAQIAQDKAQAAIAAEAAKHTRGFVAAVRAQTQVDLTALLADTDLTEFLAVKSEEFNGLIRNLSSDVLQRIERETLGAIFEGRSNESIARAIRDIDGIGRKRAKLIARDQASKLNGAMNQFRQEQVGVTHYKWKTILDGRERPTHHANNDKVFEWAKPPSATGHPGHDINCRCRALAILTDDPEMLAQIAEEYDTEPDFAPGGDPANADAWWNKYGKADLFAPAKAPGPVGGAHVKEFYRGPDGELWMFKPVGPAEAFRAAGEEVAYKVQRLVDPLAIEVRFIEIKGKPGSIQRWQTGLADKIDFKGTPIAKITPDELAQLQREHVVDWLTAQHDSHAAQFVRGKNGHVWGIDKGQIYRWLGQDRLSTDYHPNSMYGEAEPLYNTMFRAFGKGQISLDLTVAQRYAATLQAIPDAEFRALIEPYVEGRFARAGATVAEREAFYKLALDRKNGLVDEITGFYRSLDNALPPEITRLIDDVAAQGWRGKAIPLDKDGIEDHNVLVFEVDRNGKTYTVLSGKFREEYNARIAAALDPHTDGGPTGPAYVVGDVYFDRILLAIRRVNRAIDKGVDVDISVMQESAALASELSPLLSSSTASHQAMAAHYLEWIGKVERAIKDRVKVPMFSRFQYTAPTVEAKAGPFKGKLQTLITYEARKIGRDLRLAGTGLRTGRHQGREYALTWSDGTEAIYRPWTDNNPMALRGVFEVVVEGKASAGTVSKAMQRLEQWGVDVKAAQQADIELAYLRRQAAASSEHRVPEYQKLINGLAVEKASTGEQVEKLVAYWEKKLGVADLRRSPAWKPEGAHVREGGYRVHERFDVTEADIENEMSKYRIVHANTAQDANMAESVERILDGGGYMLAQTERLRVGIDVNGMSTGSDRDTGGASYFFTRIKRIKSLGEIGEGFYWKPRVLRRMDAITYDHDAYGRVTGNHRQEHHKGGSIAEWKAASKGGGNETIFKNALSLRDDLDMVVARDDRQRDRILAAFRKAGINEIDGHPIEQRIVTQTGYGGGAPKGLVNPALGKAIGAPDPKPSASTGPTITSLPGEVGVYPLTFTLKGAPKIPGIAELGKVKGMGKYTVENYVKSYGNLYGQPGMSKEQVMKIGKLVFSQIGNNKISETLVAYYHPIEHKAAVLEKLKGMGIEKLLKKAKLI